MPDALPHSGAAYTFAKRANHLRVQAASLTRGARGARVNTISLGVVSTPMGRADPAGESGVPMRALIESSGTGRNGAPNDIAEATALLLSPAASFITGTDLLVDGGVIAATRSAAAPGWPARHGPAGGRRRHGVPVPVTASATGSARAPHGVRPAPAPLSG
ncbi:SDR family oxidoreductase [Streptomyces sp. HB2AG]|uniref:SDR family oxidoreductase n=1 Tax=Streptomyces sp. HB2AG TaxID=2983400 RepID=UPI003FA6BF14